MSNFELIGSSSNFRAVLEKVSMVAGVNCTVLIQGETGTGKEVIARAIHEASSRSHQRFAALNCAAIPAALLESELFGHERGAFTGAVAQRIGRFQAADRGTLFLDEIGDLPLELQPKLLRAIQEREVERLGGSRAIQLDVRVIAATNQDLSQMVQDKKFRADLYYRLNVFPITVPPLREREEDIPLLAWHFVEKFAREQGKAIDTIPEDVMEALESHHWPGNIRELQNVIERGVIITTGRVLSRQTVEHLRRDEAAPVRVPALAEPVSITTLTDAERAHITATLHRTNWVVGGPRGAAAQLGLPRTTLLAKMQRLGISSGVTRSRSGEPRRPVVRMMGDLSARLRDDSSAGLHVVGAMAS